MTSTMRETLTQASPAVRMTNGRLRVAFQGELGAYSDQAIVQCWNGAATAIPSASFNNVIEAVASGAAEYGILPVWNTVVGDIEPGAAAVRLGRSDAYGLAVTSDARVVVRHHLLGLPGTALDEIDSVASHAVALAQCGRFLATCPNIEPVAVYDTAGAARELVMNGKRTSAAIAGRIAAELYGLTILKADIQDVPDNVTHFLVLARPNRQSGDPMKLRDGEVVRW